MTEHVHRHHHADMLSVEEARDRILQAFETLEPACMNITDSIGLVISEDVYSSINIPPLDNSGMDGYALRSEDVQSATLANPVSLRIVGTVPAGHLPDFVIEAGEAARIMTGAAIPDGANSVVPFEETTESEGFDRSELRDIGIRTPVKRGSDIRLAGGDVTVDQKVLQAGTLINPSTIAVLASLGRDTINVYRKPEVAILSTGDELIEPGLSSEPGKIYDSNTSGLIASVIAAGGIPKPFGIVRDNLSQLEEKISEAMNSDLVVTSAGVSKGDYDVVKDALASRGILNFWSIRMRPAKPLAFGVLNDEKLAKVTPLIGLPGNPVSSMVAFEQFCRPAIRKMLGKKSSLRPTIKATLTDHIYNHDGRRVYARVKIVNEAGSYTATTSGSQESNILTSMAYADGLAICPEDVPVKGPGESVTVIMLNWPEEMI